MPRLLLLLLVFTAFTLNAPPAEADFLGNLKQSTQRNLKSIGNSAKRHGSTISNRAKDGASRAIRSGQDKMRSGMNTARQKGNSVKRDAKRAVREQANRGGKAAKSAYQKGASSAQNALRHGTNTAKTKANAAAKYGANVVRDQSGRTFDAAKEAAKQRRAYLAQSASRTLDAGKKAAGTKSQELRRGAAVKAGELGAAAVRKQAALRQQAALSATKLSASARDQFHQLSARGQAAAADALKTGRESVAKSTMSFLAHADEARINAVRRSGNLLTKIDNKVRDPKTRQTVMNAALVAAAVGYTAYQRRDDIGYVITREVMQEVHVPGGPGGRLVPLEQVLRDQIVAQAPFLEGTSIAEDPAMIVAYGLKATSTRALVEEIPLIPSSSGNITVEDAVSGTDSGAAALAFLQIGASAETLAIGVAQEGHLGPEMSTLAGSYVNANDYMDNMVENDQ